MTFPDRLRRARYHAALTQHELAIRAGSQREMICRYEAGSTIPRPDTLRRLAFALDVTPTFLLTGTHKEMKP